MTERTHRPGRRQRIAALLASFSVLAAILAIAPASASALVINNVQFVVEPPASVAPDENFTVAVGVYNAGILQPGAGVSISISVAGATFGCSSGTTVTTAASGIATYTGCSIHNIGTWNILADHGDGWGTDLSNPVTVQAGTGLQLSFSQQPGGAAVGMPLSPQPRIRVLDASFVPTNAADGTTVYLEIASGPGIGILSCTGGNSAVVFNSYATFSGCSISSGGNYTLRGWTAPGGPASATSTSFTVGSGIPDHLVFTQTPTGTVGTALTPAPRVQVVDSAGNPVAALVRISLQLQAFTGSGSLGCTLNPDWTGADTGSLTFTGCNVTGSGTFWLRATDINGGLGSVDSSSFTVGGTSSQIVFQTQPLGANLGGATPTGQVGVAWATQPIIAIKDINNNTVTTDNSTRVRLSITGGTPTSGGPGALTCTSNEVTVLGGLAYFQGCSINTAGTGYTLTATVTASPLGTVPIGAARTSLAFNISSVSQLAFTTQPLGAYTGNIPNGSAGVAWTTQPVVAVRTPSGTVITSDSTTRVQLSITPGTPITGGPGTLTCTNGTALTVTAGSAAFQGCSISATGTMYQLRATVISSTTVPVGSFVDSLPFSLTMAAANISLTTYPSVVTWGDPFTATIQFTGGGNHAYTLQRLTTPDNGIWQNILSGTTDSTGRAVVQYTPRFNGQYKVVFNGDATLGAGTSNLRTVNVRNLVLLRPEWSGVRTVNVGYTQTYTATVRPVPSGGLPGGVSRVEFMFYRLSGGQWTKVKSVVVPLNSSGVGTLRYTWNSAGTWYIRARTLANPYNFVGTSDLQRMNVQ